MEPLLSVRATAALLGLSETTVRHWVQRKEIAFVKLGGRVLFRRSDLEQLIADSVHPAKPGAPVPNKAGVN